MGSEIAPSYFLPPRCMNTKNISLKQALIIIPLVFIGIIAVSGMVAESGTPDEAQPVPTAIQTAAFDVPALMGMNVDEVKSVLGAPTDDTEPKPEHVQISNEWWKEFERDGQTLLVTYNTKTKAVIDFFISTTDPSGATRDTASLLAVGNLTEGDSRYDVEFVAAIREPSVYTGVKAVPR